jgi:hypothetical protein
LIIYCRCNIIGLTRCSISGVSLWNCWTISDAILFFLFFSNYSCFIKFRA